MFFSLASSDSTYTQLDTQNQGPYVYEVRLDAFFDVYP